MSNLMTSLDEPAVVSVSTDPAQRLGNVSWLLRGLGAALVVAAMSSFMLQQWSDGSDTTRYLTLLGLTGLLAVSGFLCGLGVREVRAARTFLALVLAAVPVHFAVLGGLLQSQFPWDLASAASAPWNASDPTQALWLTAIGIGALLPLTWLSMATLARPHARWLTLAFVTAALPILIPIRDPDLVGWLLVGMVALVSLLQRSAAGRGYAMRTPEGRFVRWMMVVPIGVVTARAVLWYGPTLLFTGLTLLSVCLACYDWMSRGFEDRDESSILQGTLSAGVVFGWFFIAGAAVQALPVPAQLQGLLFALPASGLLMVLSARSVGSGAPYRWVAACLAVGASLVNLVVYWRLEQLSIAAVACLLVGITTLAYGIYAKRKLPLGLGLLASLAAFTQLLVAAIEIEHLLHWGSLAGIGVALIFVAALCERHARRMLAYAGQMRLRIREWGY